MSGGVDSSVAAFLLKERGFSPVGVFIKFWKENNSCYRSDEQRRAKEVCNRLKIPFYVIDAQKEFKKEVVDYYLKSYKGCETPNPCVVCNRKIKLKTLMEKLQELKADYISTGHYACLQEGSEGTIKLLKGKDKEKDQSYFLWDIKKEWLAKIIFPLGEFKKKKVKKIAKDLRFSSVEAEESQEACFVGGDADDFLKRNIAPSPGKVIDDRNNVVGEHEGLFYYTVGQRKRLGLSGGPYYVLAKDASSNTLVVTKKEAKLYSKEFFYRDANFFSSVSFPLEAETKIRYKGGVTDAIVKEKEVTLSSPERAITPGQSVVFYRGEEVLGGGVIDCFE